MRMCTYLLIFLCKKCELQKNRIFFLKSICMLKNSSQLERSKLVAIYTFAFFIFRRFFKNDVLLIYIYLFYSNKKIDIFYLNKNIKIPIFSN